ncbi:MAG: membrane integrity-associated transporter subunit PqiC [Proteobacteria bacterium]|nr:membrane integrity-associated transporter subunit PqiC [Pseudomonadota bacterium]
MKAAALCLLAVATVSGGCASSPPVHFYTLDPVKSPHPAATASRVPLQVGAAHLPRELDRKTLVSQNAANSLTIAEQDRWGAPLADLLRRVLTQDLVQRLPRGNVILPESAAPAGTNVIALDILRFQKGPSGAVVLAGSWSVAVAGSDQPGPQYPVELSVPAAGGDAAAQARAMSQLVGMLADDIAARLSSANK